jgi:MtN3 and saliva related transmembrane protein
MRAAMSVPWASAIGAVAAVCSMISFTPQLIKIVRDHDAEAVSLRMYLVTVTGFGFWIAYGLMIASWPVVASNAVCLMLSGAILALKWRLSARPSPTDGRPERGSA